MKISKMELFKSHAPSFNFEHGPDELLELALERGFVTSIDGEEDLYLVNDDYEEQ